MGVGVVVFDVIAGVLSDRVQKVEDNVQIDFSAAFDRVSHSGLLYKLRDVGVGGAVFCVFAGFLSGTVVVDAIRNENVRVVSGVPHSVLGPLLFFCCTLAICRLL